MKRRYGVRNERVDQKRSDFEIDFAGVRAELAVARVFNTQPNLAILGLRGDGGISDMTILGWTVQVKHTPYEYGKLLFKPGDYLKADIAILCTDVKGPYSPYAVAIVAWTTREEFARKHTLQSHGYAPCPTMHQHQMRPIRTLVELYLASLRNQSVPTPASQFNYSAAGGDR